MCPPRSKRTLLGTCRRRRASPVPHHPYAATPTERQPIDSAELVRFKEKLQRTMEELIDEYGKLLLPKPPA